MKIILDLLLLTAGLPACSPRLALPTGDYQQTGGPGVVLLSSKQLRLLPGQRFEYFVHTDMVGQGRHGTGTYEQRGRQLRLLFDGQPLGRDMAWAQARTPALASRPPDPDSLTLTFRVWAVVGRDAPVPYAGATVLGRDAGGRVITGTACDSAGQAGLRVARHAPPLVLEASGVGSSPWRESWAARTTAYDVYLPFRLGTRYAAGAVREFRVLGQTADRLELRDGADTTVLKREKLVSQAN